MLEHRHGVGSASAGVARTMWGHDHDGRLASKTRDEGDGSVRNGGGYADTFAFDLDGNCALLGESFTDDP